MIITIDGPVASGKSSIAHRLAADRKIHHLNTGLLYRTVALLMQQGADPQGDWITQLKYHVASGTHYTPSGATILLEGKPVQGDLYGPDIDQTASRVSADAHIRQLLLPVQRQVAQECSVVADGRDCGSIVFPEADAKIYLTASEKVRAQRLMQDPERRYAAMSLEAVMAEIEQRDQRDKERAVAPLIIPEGATVIDSSDLTFEQTVVRCNEVVLEQAPGISASRLLNFANEYCRAQGCCDYKKT